MNDCFDSIYSVYVLDTRCDSKIYREAFSRNTPFSNIMSPTSSATPCDNSNPRPPAPYAWKMNLLPGIFSVSILIPPSLAGLRPTMSRTMLNFPSLPGAKGNHLVASSRSLTLVSLDGLGSRSRTCLVPPIMVPPPSGLGTQKVQDPSAFWRVRVMEQGL